MSDLIIKGMEIPERCGRCYFVRWSNLHQTAWCKLAQEACFENFSKDYKNRRADFCPLVEIPTPHGRLIDADELMEEITAFVAFGSVDYSELKRVVKTMNAAVEADGDEE